jgi:hypothetical protein
MWRTDIFFCVWCITAFMMFLHIVYLLLYNYGQSNENYLLQHSRECVILWFHITSIYMNIKKIEVNITELIYLIIYKLFASWE